MSSKRIGAVVAILVLALIGCGTPSLQPHAANVQLGQADPPKGCQALGSVGGSGGALSGGEEGAKNQLRNNAAQKGANYVRLDQVADSSAGAYAVQGTAYRCPQ